MPRRLELSDSSDFESLPLDKVGSAHSLNCSRTPRLLRDVSRGNGTNHTAIAAHRAVKREELMNAHYSYCGTSEPL
ncbi:hypothetical protein VZT92_005047 [Zoarces viviparus]|uniref:Uncharacterized protein n=1 Tax=Zoarces viviparus TaxID=48416 RepID=A0AAW1FUR2_ZOAVI